MSNYLITSFDYNGYMLYGRRFIELFLNYWPKSVKLLIYVEPKGHGTLIQKIKHLVARCDVEVIDLEGASALMKDFLYRYSGFPYANGKEKYISSHKWKSKDLEEGYCFRYDAIKFSKKVFAIHHAAHAIASNHKLFWIDADVITFKSIPESFLDEVLPMPVHICYLGRGNYHSECGFVGYNLYHREMLSFIDFFAKLYSTGEVFNIDEWHDSFVFDYVRGLYKLKENDLSVTKRGHVWTTSILANYMDHLKGDRKVLGYSPEMRRNR